MNSVWPKYRKLIIDNNLSMYKEIHHTTALSRGNVFPVISIFNVLATSKKSVCNNSIALIKS